MDRRNNKSDQRPLRQILPTPAASQKDTPVPPKRALRVSAACEPCRSRKSKCDGIRPRCSECGTRGSDCRYKETESRQVRKKYNNVRDKLATYKDMVELLRTLPEKDAIEVVHRIRAGGDVEIIVRQIREGNLLMELSVAPQSRMRYEFPYMAYMPPGLITPKNPYLKSLLYEALQPSAGPMEMDVARPLQDSSPYAKPYHAAELVEPKLADAQPSKWTSVSSDDRLMRNLLHAYFINDHPATFLFHKDYFLEDLLDGNTRFCSSLLVNALLAKSCTTCARLPNRAKFWDPDNPSYRFLAEARRLWELESDEAKLTTIQAGCLINLSMNVNGYDRLGRQYTAHAYDLAQRMSLFQPCQGQPKDHKFEDARILMAWGLATWQTMQSYYYFSPPLLIEMPSQKLPDAVSEPNWYGELRLHYPLDQEVYPMGFGLGVKALIELRAIMNDICVRSFHRSGSARKIPWDHALQIWARLQEWYETLPEAISHSKLLYPAHLRLHCEYHSTVIMLFNSQLAKMDDIADPLLSSQRDTAQSIIYLATVKLESVLRIYYLRHSFESYDMLLPVFLAHMCHETISRLLRIDRSDPTGSDEEIAALRSTLILCLRGLHDQFKNFYISGPILEVLHKRLSTEDRDLVGQYITLKYVKAEDDGVEKPQRVLSDYVMPIVSLHDDPEAARLSNLVQHFVTLKHGD